MSTILISKNVIDYLLTAAKVLSKDTGSLPVYLQCNEYRRPKIDPFEALGQELHERNVESYKFAYANRGKITADKYVFTEWPIRKFECLDPVQVLKTLDFYEYQSDDDEAIADTRVARFLEWMRAGWVRKLPGYEEAEWGAPLPSTPKTEVGGRLGYD